MKVSIITVCYNPEKTIKDTIDSGKPQTYLNIEYIVVDGVYLAIVFYDFTLTKKAPHYTSSGFHSLNFKIATDFDYLIMAFSVPNSSFHYMQEEVVKMREQGVGTSGISANILLNKGIIQSCRKNGLSCSWLLVHSKYPEKTMGLLLK
ncbi:glycosyltransferase [Vibrio sp. AH4]|uniref:glycosyltransferase n=1 Tax=Vibrio sp. AH4 TaxID=2919577 RepID=UPI002739DE6D|nr:glycosyltransferase [Vibrio sp. AH4]MDP4491815.1 hypothetical protein [Vibrio sp. AH4]